MVPPTGTFPLSNHSWPEIWEKSKKKANLVYDAGSKSTIAFVAGIALNSIASSFACVFLGAGLGIFVSRLVVNVVSSYNSETLTTIKRRLCDFWDNHRILCVISLIFVVIIGTQYPKFGFAIAAVFGAATGLVIDELKNKKLIHLDRNQQEQEQQIDSVV